MRDQDAPDDPIQMRRRSVLSLLQLPSELHQVILEYLPLSSRIIYQLQLCATIRTLLSRINLLSKCHHIDLIEWNIAQRELIVLLHRQQLSLTGQAAKDEKEKITEVDKVKIQKQSIWDISPSSTPRPAPSKFSSTLTPLPPLLMNGTAELRIHKERSKQEDEHSLIPIHGDHPDVALFVQALRLLRKHSASSRYPDKLKVLSLLCRNGFKVASLIYLLENDTNLSNIETVLMTSANCIDAVLWTVFTPPKAKLINTILQSRQSTHFDLEFSHSTCIDTQAIVIPGPKSQKGQGLRSGFKCLCFSNFLHANDKKDAYVPFHVIFHDWYNEEEAISTQDMLENSDITCNTCKHAIHF